MVEVVLTLAANSHISLRAVNVLVHSECNFIVLSSKASNKQDISEKKNGDKNYYYHQVSHLKSACSNPLHHP